MWRWRAPSRVISGTMRSLFIYTHDYSTYIYITGRVRQYRITCCGREPYNSEDDQQQFGFQMEKRPKRQKDRRGDGENSWWHSTAWNSRVMLSNCPRVCCWALFGNSEMEWKFSPPKSCCLAYIWIAKTGRTTSLAPNVSALRCPIG